MKKETIKEIILYIVVVIIGVFLGFNISAELGWKGILLSIFMLLVGFIFGKLSIKDSKKKQND